VNRAEHDLFFSRLMEVIFKAKSDVDLFVSSNNFLQDVIKRAFKEKFPYENQRLRVPTKIKKLKEIGFLLPEYATNCSLMYKIRQEFAHTKAPDFKPNKKRVEDLCNLFIGTPAAKLLRSRKSPYFEKYSESVINTLNEMDLALLQKRNTQLLGKIISKKEAEKLRRKLT